MLFPNFSSFIAEEYTGSSAKMETLAQPKEEFLSANVTEWLMSTERANMLKAEKYYRNQTDVLERIRTYIDRGGIQKEAVNMTNNKLPHSFLRKLTRQKVNYILTREPTLKSEDETFVKKLHTEVFTAQFLKMLKGIGREAIVKGISWVQTYYDAMGKLNFKRIPAEELYPFWSDADHTSLEAMLRIYYLTHYLEKGAKKLITKVEFYTPEGVWYYEQTDKGLIEDPDKPVPTTGHFTTLSDSMGPDNKTVSTPVEAVWERVPFIAFKYNADEISLLDCVKALIDDYDRTTSDTSNNLADIPNSIKVVKGHAGTDAGEFTQNLAVFRTVFVSQEGDVTSLSTPMDTQSTEAHLDRLRKDIYEGGSGIDTQSADLGNASGVALKFRYSDLDMDCSEIANEFSSALMDLLWYVRVDMLNQGKGNYMESDVEVVFNTDGIVNDSETIADAKNSVGVVSEETILANHPWVTDVEKEQAALQGERDKAMEDAMGMAENQANLDSEDSNNSPPAKKSTTKEEI